MGWTAQAEALLFRGVLERKDVKLTREDYQFLSKYMGGEFTAEAIRQRMIKKIRKSGPLNGSNPAKAKGKAKGKTPAKAPGTKSKGEKTMDGTESSQEDEEETPVKKRASSRKRTKTSYAESDSDQEEEAEAESPTKKIKKEMEQVDLGGEAESCDDDEATDAV